MNAKEIVRALRAQSEPALSMSYKGEYKWHAEDIGSDAAALIESLQARLFEYDALAAEYGIDGKTMLTLAKSQIRTAKSNVELQEQLVDSQRRADVAVEDMQRIVQEHGECYGCVHYDHDGEICTHAEYIITCSPDDKNDRWEWRGPQDEKGAEL